MANRIKIKDTEIKVGSTVRLSYRIIEKEKKSGTTKRSTTEEVRERIQPFEGMVIKIGGSGANRSFTVRKMGSNGIGIERIFAVDSPWIKGVKTVSEKKVRRAKLYYLRANK